MNRSGWIALTVSALTLVSTLAVFGATLERKRDAHASRVERGRYLTEIMACNDCHTPGFFYGAPDFQRQLSGSELGWTGPWGTSFPRNLTPDMETGIGKWSERDIVTALRTGVRPNGTVLMPPMPWANYVNLSDGDAYAIAAFLKSLPPVRHKAPALVPPGVEHDHPAMRFPAPPAWDAPPTAAAQ